MTHSKKLIAPLGMIKRPVFICLLLALVTLVIYRPALTAQFIVYDDPDYVTANQHVLTGLMLAEFAMGLCDRSRG